MNFFSVNRKYNETMDNMNNHSGNVKAIYYSSLHSLTNPNANFNNIGVEGADLLSHWVGECMNLGPKVDESKFNSKFGDKFFSLCG